jgi:hypothetical protein
MENVRVIYKLEDGGVAVLMPAFDCGLTIEQIIQKDVPPNTPYKIIDINDLPEDKTFRNAWEYVE